MWCIIEDEDRVELEFGSLDILDYMGRTLLIKGEDGITDGFHIVSDAFITEHDWFDDNDDWPQANAYRKCMGCTIQEAFDQWEEAYQGKYNDDEEFAYDLAEQLGAIDKKASWPNTCIDWEQAAEEIMYDYFESDGFYFRNL